ncbi:MAG: tRNA uridine-5-carboxymethylaminomethyl(34) synthesis GTPase MnmE [Solobacterium sp.]|nr:tRNA uridine-5-carboxymethylaminomethyl(34) synthesis GTPase MnmE [Solobacterium sp.]
MFKDTIVAIATGASEGAISIVRLSGEDAIAIVNDLFDKNILEEKGYTIHYGTILEEGKPVDEVLVNLFRAPKSYTGEDMVEINCHGGHYVTRKVLSLCLGKGARMARNGEFTERAYLNGHLDLAQAESVNDLIRAQDDINATSAIYSLKGSVKELLDPLTEDLTQILSQIEVNIDYPEYDDVKQLTEEEILPKAKEWLSRIEEIINEAKQAVFIRGGIKTAIVGKPNVGKSSLLNALLEEDKAIVTEIAGTTRDLVEGTVRIGNVTLNLVDTAGIHESEDRIEQMGIARSIQAIEKAQLILLVLDAASELDEQDQELLEKTKDKDRILIYNKKDQKELPDTIAVSALNHDIKALKDAIEQKYQEEIRIASSSTLNNERQIGLALEAKGAMQDAIASLEAGAELDLVTIDLQKAYYALKEITGEVSKEDFLEEVFSRFCLGK